ncbi:MAG: SH3 domain-containing protein [Anaerolineales bacterium]|nr:SH3 domain-containing protein [Anaerolineales bacterium]
MQGPIIKNRPTVHWMRQYWLAFALVLLTAGFVLGARSAFAASADVSINQTVPPPTPRPTTAPPKPKPNTQTAAAAGAVAAVTATDVTTGTAPTTPLTATVQAVTLNVRGGPATSFPVIGKLPQGTVVNVSGRNEAGDWWFICCLAGSATPGWVSAELLTPGFTPAQAAALLVTDGKTVLPTPATTAGGKPGTVNAVTLNLRAGPATDGAVLAKLRQGNTVSVLGRNEAGDWLFVCCAPDAQTRGWVSAEYITPAFSAGDLEVTTGAESEAPAVDATTPVSATNEADAANVEPAAKAILNLSVAQSPVFAIQGKALSLLITLENSGDTAATNVELRNELPNELAYVDASASANGAVSQDGNVVVVKWVEVPAGAMVTATVNTTVDGAIANGATFANLVTATAGNAEPVGAGITVGMPPSILPEFW